MLKTNEQMLKEKIEYANNKIKKYESRIENLIELIKYNRAIIDNLQNKRKHEEVFYDIEKNEAKKLKKNAVKATEYEKQLREENQKLANQLDIAERHLVEIKKTKERLQSILDPKSKEKTLR